MGRKHNPTEIVFLRQGRLVPLRSAAPPISRLRSRGICSLGFGYSGLVEGDRLAIEEIS